MNFFKQIEFAALVVFAVSGLAGRALAAPEVSWEVENRFRFYQKPEPFKAYLKVAKDLRTAGTDDWILRTERKLQQIHLSEAKSREKEWNGWASEWMDATCWSRTGYVLINEDRCEDYTLPGSHRVLLSVAGVDNATTKCTVKTSVITTLTPKQFNQKRRTELFNQRRKEAEGRQTNVGCQNIPVEVPFSTSGDAGVEVTVTLIQAGSQTDLPAQPIIVKDLLVLGMGDSFAAGVGNPDRPAQLTPNGGIIYGGGDTGLPVRDKGFTGADLQEISAAQAKWLDIRCFRSQYGPQFRSALHLATDLPHSAVTFLDLSCDGARIIEGLLHRKTLDSGYDLDPADAPEPQPGMASRLLCASDNLQTKSYKLRFASDPSQCRPQRQDEICEYGVRKYQREAIDKTSMKVCAGSGADAFRRKIDVLLLSIGGNDIGFAPMVGNVLLGDIDPDQKMLRYLAKEFGMIHPAHIGKARLGFLHGKYQILDQAIDRYLPLRQGPNKPVFLTAYPLPADDRDGEICGGSKASASAARDALDSNPGFDGFKEPPSAALSRLKAVINTSCLLNIRRLGWFNGGADADAVLQQLTDSGKACEGLANNSQTELPKINWQFEFAMLQKWQGHGFCAVRDGADARQSLSIPSFTRSPGAPAWTPPFDRMRPYDSRQRWVRTPNDAFAITNWQTFAPQISDPVNLLSASTTSAMHPTAEGYASMADSLRARVATFICSERASEFGSEPLCASP
jgi:hypothetical protein